MTPSYNAWLVLLSIAVAVLAAYSALSLTRRVTTVSGARAWVWLACGAVVMGGTVWAMHFVGMLAFRLPIALGYDPAWTAASGVAAIASSFVALFLVSRPRLSGVVLCAGGLTMGAGISTMHYVGMHAMRMRPAIQYDPYWFTASVLIAIAASFAALLLVFALHRAGGWARLLAAVVMGLAISGMHYTGMAAARFDSASLCLSATGVAPGTLAALTLSVIVGLALVTLLTAYFDSRLETQGTRYTRLLEDANDELLRRALHDPVTQLANRTQFEARLRQAVKQANGGRVAVLFVDLDGFKPVNDALGHQAGDEVLRMIACRLELLVGGSGLAARVGGDEFALLLERVDHLDEVTAFAREVVERIRQPLPLMTQELELSASVGVALTPDHDDGSALLRKADLAMNAAKQRGRDGLCVYQPEFDLAALDAIELMRDLRHAIERGELQLYYQPKVRTVDGRVGGVEALMRWRHPQRGNVSPGVFIPLAERCGLIAELGRWTLREACRQARSWQQQGLELPVAVNLSPQQFRERGLVRQVFGLLREFELDARLLVLEITEASVMEQERRVQGCVRRLVSRGVRVSIDDFGTGYSNLSRMQDIPLAELKLDRSFVQGLSAPRSTRPIVEAIVRLSQALSLKLVAEGVETVEQARVLSELGCDELQGFLYSPAVPAEAMPALVLRLETRHELAA